MIFDSQKLHFPIEFYFKGVSQIISSSFNMTNTSQTAVLDTSKRLPQNVRQASINYISKLKKNKALWKFFLLFILYTVQGIILGADFERSASDFGGISLIKKSK